MITKEQLKEKTIELLNNAHEEMVEKIDKAINSGCMDLENADNNYLLPKILVSALLKDMVFQYKPMGDTKKAEKEILNIYSLL